MDAKLQLQSDEIEQFLSDVRDHFRAALETCEYANTFDIFSTPATDVTVSLLQRCEQILAQFAISNDNQQRNGMHAVEEEQPCMELNGETTAAMATATATAAATTTTTGESTFSNECRDNEKPASSSDRIQQQNNALQLEEKEHKPSIYLNMNQCSSRRPDLQTQKLNEAHDSTSGNRTASNSSAQAVFDANLPLAQAAAVIKDDDLDSDYDEGDSQFYDICQISQMDPDESLTRITPESEVSQITDCPYLMMPASQMPVENPSKYGQLQRVEKRLFFDQTKKYYCGILNDWLLCYSDGPTSTRPTITLHLKSNGIEIEHYGDGKRRELSFQITTADPNNKFIFQAVNEVDAKEWIIAVEAAIRGDSVTVAKSARKLPTPPAKKRNVSLEDNISESDSAVIYQNCEYMYEVPSQLCRGLQLGETLKGKANADKKDSLTEKGIARKFDYDIPKYPAQPVKSIDPQQMESETMGLLNLGESSATPSSPKDHTEADTSLCDDDKRDFHSFIKDMHTKLSSQLTAGPNTDRLKKSLKKTYSNSSTESENTILATPPAFVMDNKKQRTSNMSSSSESSQKNEKKINEVKTDKVEKSDKAAKNWFLIRLSKASRNPANPPQSPKSKQSERQNLLSLEWYDSIESDNNNKSNRQSIDECDTSPGKSVNVIIKELEASGHVGMFSMEALTHNVVATFHETDNNYEPIMAVSTPASSYAKKD